MTDKDVLTILSACDFTELTEFNYDVKILKRIKDEYDDYEIGCTKLALFFPDYDYVIKIPFKGFLFDSGEGDEFYPFECADDANNGDNYCEAEVLRYQAAKDAGLQQFFEENICIGEIQGTPIYKQALCTPYSYASEVYVLSNLEEREAVEAFCESKNLDCFNPEWLTEVAKTCGTKVLEELLQFIEDYNISDLHNGNIGYKFKNHFPVIFDYASFEDCQ